MVTPLPLSLGVILLPYKPLKKLLHLTSTQVHHAFHMTWKTDFNSFFSLDSKTSERHEWTRLGDICEFSEQPLKDQRLKKSWTCNLKSERKMNTEPIKGWTKQMRTSKSFLLRLAFDAMMLIFKAVHKH